MAITLGSAGRQSTTKEALADFEIVQLIHLTAGTIVVSWLTICYSLAPRVQQ
jgi:hypothetical protein